MALSLRLPCQLSDPDRWHPVGTSGPSLLQAEEAKAECRPCPAREACLRRALDLGNVSGIWGATDEAERFAMLKRGVRV